MRMNERQDQLGQQNPVVLPCSLWLFFPSDLVARLCFLLNPPQLLRLPPFPSLSFTISCLPFFTPASFYPSYESEARSQQAGARQWGFILGKESQQCLPCTEALSQAQDSVGGGHCGGQEPLAGRTEGGPGCRDPTGL